MVNDAKKAGVNMDYYKIEQTKDGLQIDGFPEAAKVINLDGPEAKR